MAKIPLTLWVKARDRVTWFTWIVTAHIKYLTGCDRFQLTPLAKKDGTVPDSMAFDQNSLEVVDKGISADFDVITPRSTGGPSIYKCRN